MPNPSELLTTHFPHQPTAGQQAFFQKLDAFLVTPKPRSAFVLKGYAGTGKTTTISALVKILKYLQIKPLLLAPTGRAAKVMAFYSNRKAFTIHKIIFKQSEDPYSGSLRFVRQPNSTKQKTLYIVDEASMINHSDGMGSSLLTDLIDYVFDNPENGHQLLLVGDTAQLPPVHQTESKALNPEFLAREFRLSVTAHTLTEVLRQKQASGILENATRLRDFMGQKKWQVELATKIYPDFYRMDSTRLEDGLRYAYNKHGVEQTTIVCRSNRAATQYNQFIRRQIHNCEQEVDAGDFLMIVRNNYFWLSPTSPAGFLANGEFVEVRKVRDEQEQHGLRFAQLTLQLVDYPDQPPFDAWVILDTLQSFSPNLGKEESQALFENVCLQYADAEDKKEQMAMARIDPFLNALQVKYAYALTCHKSQGGQWSAVFIDLGFIPESGVDLEMMRWLYTAITRATEEVFLVNFPPSFFV